LEGIVRSITENNPFDEDSKISCEYRESECLSPQTLNETAFHGSETLLHLLHSSSSLALSYGLPPTAAAVLTMYSLSTAILCGGRDCKLYMESCKFSVLSASVDPEAVPFVSDAFENLEDTQAECFAGPWRT
jgi:hypothetical protein